MRALSLLYRHDLGGDLRAAFVFEMEGPGGGNWHVDVSPEGTSSAEGIANHPSLAFHMNKTDPGLCLVVVPAALLRPGREHDRLSDQLEGGCAYLQFHPS